MIWQLHIVKLFLYGCTIISRLSGAVNRVKNGLELSTQPARGNLTMSQLFNGKKLLVVGGSSGMGFATAKHLQYYKGAAHVVIVGNKAEKTEQARQRSRNSVKSAH